MKNSAKLKVLLAMVLIPAISLAQSDDANDADELKIAALEALMSAPPERAMPLVSKVLAGNHSNEVKESALFILNQIDSEEAQATLLNLARDGRGDLQAEAIRMVGIGGDASALASLGQIYQAGDEDTRDAVLEAYLIADDKNAVFEIAVNADNEDDFEEAVEILGAMGASDELRELRTRTGMSSALIEAYAVSGDFETLREAAMDGSDTELQAEAIEAMGIVGGEQVNSTLVEIYKGAATDEIREAALDGMLISGHDAGVLELYSIATNTSVKRELLEYLVMMDSDAIFDVIDSALAEDQ